MVRTINDPIKLFYRLMTSYQIKVIITYIWVVGPEIIRKETSLWTSKTMCKQSILGMKHVFAQCLSSKIIIYTNRRNNFLNLTRNAAGSLVRDYP